jgi:hypothetical protein
MSRTMTTKNVEPLKHSNTTNDPSMQQKRRWIQDLRICFMIPETLYMLCWMLSPVSLNQSIQSTKSRLLLLQQQQQRFRADLTIKQRPLIEK